MTAEISGGIVRLPAERQVLFMLEQKGGGVAALVKEQIEQAVESLRDSPVGDNVSKRAKTILEGLGKSDKIGFVLPVGFFDLPAESHFFKVLTRAREPWGIAGSEVGLAISEQGFMWFTPFANPDLNMSVLGIDYLVILKETAEIIDSIADNPADYVAVDRGKNWVWLQMRQR